MLISKISFTSESNLLNQINKNVLPQDNKPQETQTLTLASVQNNKVRNWSIGLGSAAVLIGLGVLGRRGNLGEGVQKVLGGAKKNASEFVQSFETRLNEAVAEIPKAPEAPKFVDAEKINASLNRSIPKIDVPSKIAIPDVKYLAEEFRNLHISGIKDNYNKIQLPNGNTREVLLTCDGKSVANIFDTNNSGERVLEANFINSEFLDIKKGCESYNFRGVDLYRYALDKNSKIYNYNADGVLTYISECNKHGQVTRNICFENGTQNVKNIVYIDPDTNKIIKQDIFKNDKIIGEVFYGSQGEILKPLSV